MSSNSNTFLDQSGKTVVDNGKQFQTIQNLGSKGSHLMAQESKDGGDSVVRQSILKNTDSSSKNNGTGFTDEEELDNEEEFEPPTPEELEELVRRQCAETRQILLQR